jgi:hypothetical protein
MIKNVLIDKYLPQYTFNEYHEIVVNSPIENVYNVTKDLDISKSKIIVFLLKMRGMPTERLNLQDFIDDIGFIKIEENYPYENVVGFLLKSKVAKIPSHENFINNSISPWVKGVWNFQFEELEKNKTKVSTETRILCVAPITKITFRLYWFFIKPFSKLIRKIMLNIIKEESESINQIANNCIDIGPGKRCRF